MANVYATKNGNWSDVTVWNTGSLPTSADDVFANNFTVSIDVDFTVLSVRNESETGITAGGGFVLDSGRTIACTGLGIRNANTTCVTFSTTGTSYINSNITNNGSAHCVSITSTGTLYIVGNINSSAGNGFATLNATAACSVYVTGSVRIGGAAGGRCIIASNFATFYITGNVSKIVASNANFAIMISANSSCYVTGNVFFESTFSSNSTIISNSGNLNVVGSLNAQATNGGRHVIESLSATTTNLLSGPFISSLSGILPFYLFRMHLIRTIGTYLEFRDETTNGASPPPVAPSTRLVSPDTAADAPVPTDVRDGVVYALGAFTGTLKVPSPNNVALNIPTDNTVGTALLKPEDVWDYATSLITDTNSIGARLKNCSTVDTTGEQLEALL